MNRIAAILCMLLIWGCADEPKRVSSASIEDVVTTEVNTPVQQPVVQKTEVKEEVAPKVEKVKPAVKKERKPIPKEVKPPVKKKYKPAPEKVKPPVKKESIIKPQPVTQPQAAPSTFANISFDKMIHEFGEIDEGDKITHSFKFKNTGNAPLIIDNVDVSCGCTMPTYPIIPIGPGETGAIGVIYNSKGKFGTQKPSITIKTNATEPIVKLYLSGSIKHVFEKTKTDTTVTEG